MKYIYSFLFTISIYSGYTQSLNFNDLMKMQQMSIENLEIFLTSKNFEFNKIQNHETAKSYCYSSKLNGQINSYICKWEYKNGTKYLSFQTNQTIYNSIKQEGLNNGMKFISTEDIYNKKGYFSTYQFGKTKIEFWVSEGQNNKGITVYEINISKY